jgi:hypothetical protein
MNFFSRLQFLPSNIRLFLRPILIQFIQIKNEIRFNQQQEFISQGEISQKNRQENYDHFVNDMSIFQG